MNLFQVKPVSQAHQISFPQLTRNFKAALSYVSFYSTDSPFVVQAVQKCHKDIHKLLQAFDSLALYREADGLLLNGSDLSDWDDLLKIFQEKNVRGVQIEKGLTVEELTIWLKQISQPISDQKENKDTLPHIHMLSQEDVVKVVSEPETSENKTGLPLTFSSPQNKSVNNDIFLKPFPIPTWIFRPLQNLQLANPRMFPLSP